MWLVLFFGLLPLYKTYEAWVQLQGRRTHTRHAPMWRGVVDTTDHASVLCCFFVFVFYFIYFIFLWIRVDLVLTHTKPGRFESKQVETRPESDDIICFSWKNHTGPVLNYPLHFLFLLHFIFFFVFVFYKSSEPKGVFGKGF